MAPCGLALFENNNPGLSGDNAQLGVVQNCTMYDFLHVRLKLSSISLCMKQHHVVELLVGEVLTYSILTAKLFFPGFKKMFSLYFKF